MTSYKEVVSLDSIKNILKNDEFDKEQSYKISIEIFLLINWMEEHWKRVLDNMDDSPIAFEDPNPIEIKLLDGLTNSDLLKIKNEIVQLFKEPYPDEIVIKTMIDILKFLLETNRYERLVNLNIAYLLDTENNKPYSLESGSNNYSKVYEESNDYEPFLDDEEFYEEILKEQESLASDYGTGKTINVKVTKKHSFTKERE